MREVFKPMPKPKYDPGEVFYTVQPEDVGKRSIETDVGTINLSDFLGQIIKSDVGKRLYRQKIRDGEEFEYIWRAENQQQRDERVSRTK